MFDTLTDELAYIRDSIDYVFGEGYAKKNPELVGRLAQAAATMHTNDKPADLE